MQDDAIRVREEPSPQRFVVEINASHEACGDPLGCRFCAAGLSTHCPSRIVLGIHDLPGGFGPFILAPVCATIPVPADLPDDAAVLLEPFAAALHGVRRAGVRAGDVVGVLGPRRLGMLLIGALAAERRRLEINLEIVAYARREELRQMALEVGADRCVAVEGDGGALPGESVDLMFDTTANPLGLELALRLARREVHLKSTHGQPGDRHFSLRFGSRFEYGYWPQAPAGRTRKKLALTTAPRPDTPDEGRPHSSASEDQNDQVSNFWQKARPRAASTACCPAAGLPRGLR